MTEKARAVIAGEIDMPCPDDGYDEPESTELCAYACTLLRMPGAGMDEDAMELEDIRAFEFGMEHNIDVVWNIMCSLEASTIIIGAYDGVDGKQEMLGMQYANHMTPTVDIGGETYKVELVYADNGSDSAKAPTAASELVSKDVSLVLGTYGSSCAMAGGPIFGEAGLAAIGVTCTNPGVTAGNDYYFRICFLDPFQGTVLANFAQEKFSAKKAYCLGELGNEYDQGLIKYFTDAFDGEVITDSFPTNTSDFSTYLSKAVSSGAEVIFCPVSISYSTQIVKLAASMGLEIPILGSDTLDSNMVLEAASGSDVKLYVSTFYQEGGSPEFDEGIKAWLNEDATAMTNNGGNDTIAAVTAMGYDAYYVALEALKAAGSTDPAAVKAALPGVTYTGVTGDIAFDDIGDAIRDTAYIKVADTANNAWALETMQKAG